VLAGVEEALELAPACGYGVSVVGAHEDLEAQAVEVLEGPRVVIRVVLG
jgi:hypothetical protein